MMKVFETISWMTQWSKSRKQQGSTIAFVPTMGALHEGHLFLIRLAKEKATDVVVSIFVNPLQFGPTEDFKRYPRPLEKDMALLEREGVSVLFLPSVGEIIPQPFQTTVHVSGLTEDLCGRNRPGHFDGVATIVLKLFQIVKPDVAIFGDKDYQQRRLIERIVSDLNLDIKIITAPIVREPDGLAMSSRNVYLPPDQRKRATILYQALKAAEHCFHQGERESLKIVSFVSQMIDSQRPTKVDYIKICDALSLKEVKAIENRSVLAVAVYFGETRLIDNIILNPNHDQIQKLFKK